MKYSFLSIFSGDVLFDIGGRNKIKSILTHTHQRSWNICTDTENHAKPHLAQILMFAVNAHSTRNKK